MNLPQIVDNMTSIPAKARKSKRTHQGRVFGLSSRFLCFLGDLGLGYFSFHYLASYPSFMSMDKTLRELFASFSPDKAFLYSTIVMVYFLTMLWRFYANLIFGMSLFQIFGGVRAQGKFWWVRVGGAARVVLETLFGWTSLLHLPLLMKKKVLSEAWTDTDLRIKDNLFTKLFKSLMIPFWLVFSFYAPLLQNLTLIDGLVLSTDVEKATKLTNTTNFDQFFHYNSNRFKFKAFSSLNEGQLQFIPDFQITRKRGKRSIVSYISIYDVKSGRYGTFKTNKKVNLFKLIEKARVGNPLFDKSFPELAKVLNRDIGHYQIREYKKEFEKQAILNPLAIEQIEDLFKASLELGGSTLLSHTLQYGPFIRGFVELRRNILSLVRQGLNVEADFLEVGNQKFLRLRQEVGGVLEFGKEQVETWLPLGTMNALIFEMGWDKDLASALSRKTFMASFMGTVDWFFDYKKFFAHPELEAQMSPFQVVDHMTSLKLNQGQIEILEEYLFRYYYELCRSSLKEDLPALQDFLEENLKRLSLVIDIKKKGKDNKLTEAFIEQIEELKKSFIARDKNFFNI